MSQPLPAGLNSADRRLGQLQALRGLGLRQTYVVAPLLQMHGAQGIRTTDNPSRVLYPPGVMDHTGATPSNQRMAKKSKHQLHFRAWRKKKRLTQEQVAELMGISQNTVSRIETGEIDYTRGTLESLAAVYGADPADLLRAPPEGGAQDEFSIFIAKLDAKKKRQAIRILKAALSEEEDVA